MLSNKNLKLSLAKKFAIFIFLGALLIYCLSSNSLEVNLWLRASAPVLLMVLYAWYAKPKKNKEALPYGYSLTYANSIYYIGFIYTLLALAISTFSFQKDEGFLINQKDIFLILGNFGVGLATTIFGFSYRSFILFSNINDGNRRDEGGAFTGDNSEVLFCLKDISSQLAETHNEHVRNSTELTALFRKILENVKAEDIFSMHESALEKLSNNYNDALIKNQSILESVTEKSKNFFDKYDDLLMPNIEASANSFKNLSVALNAIKDVAVEAENSLGTLAVNSQKISDKYAAVLAPNIDDAASGFKYLNDCLMSIKGSMDSITAIEEEVVASMAVTSNKLKENTGFIGNSMEDLNSSIQEQIEKFSAFFSKSSVFNEYFDAADSLRKKIIFSLEKLEVRIRSFLNEKIEPSNSVGKSKLNNWVKKLLLLFKKNGDKDNE